MGEDSMTRTQLILACLTTFLLCTGSVWGMITVHAENPHRAAVSEDRFSDYKEYLEEHFDAIERDLADIKRAVQK
jgi:hypothetical protein